MAKSLKFAVVLVLVCVACVQSLTIYEWIKANSAATRAILDDATNADLKSRLNSAGSYTFFLPPNWSAYATLGSPSDKQVSVMYHTVDGSYSWDQLSKNEVFNSLVDDLRYVWLNGPQVLIVHSFAVNVYATLGSSSSSVQCSNGWIHTIQSQLSLPYLPFEKVDQYPLTNEASEFGNDMKTIAPTLVSDLVGAGNILYKTTIFAPSNQAWLAYKKSNTPTEDLIRNHVFTNQPDVYYRKVLTNGLKIQSESQHTSVVSVTGSASKSWSIDGVALNTATFDRIYKGGVVHVINGVIEGAPGTGGDGGDAAGISFFVAPLIAIAVTVLRLIHN